MDRLTTGMRALLTGGAGFIGSHLADALMARGDAVTVIDDLSTGSRDNIAHLDGRPGFACTIDSVCHEAALDALMARADVVFHLAAAVGVRLIVDAPVRTIETNVHGTETVLRVAARHRRLVVVFSTSEVYGRSAAVPFREDADLVLGPTTTPRWAYACSKALDEFLALAYARERGLPVIVVRLFNTVGPRQTDRYGMVIPTFVRQALAGEPLTVYGAGAQTRAFTDVSDVVRALLGLVHEPRAVGEVVNIGAAEETTILQLARRVIAAAGSRSDIAFVPYARAYGAAFEDLPRRVPDLTKIRDLIGFQPTVDLDATLARVVAHARGGRPAGVR